jgi:hypothetical protein
VKHSGDHNGLLILDYFVNHSIRKAFGISPTNIFPRISTATEPRIYGKLIEERQEFVHKPVTKTFAAAVIPRGNLDNVVLCFRS